MGTLVQLPGVLPQWNTSTGPCKFDPATIRTAVAAATPRPSPLAVNKPGAMSCTLAVALSVFPLSLWMVNVAVPVCVSAGTSKLICPGETYDKAATQRNAGGIEDGEPDVTQVGREWLAVGALSDRSQIGAVNRTERTGCEPDSGRSR